MTCAYFFLAFRMPASLSRFFGMTSLFDKKSVWRQREMMSRIESSISICSQSGWLLIGILEPQGQLRRLEDSGSIRYS